MRLFNVIITGIDNAWDEQEYIMDSTRIFEYTEDSIITYLGIKKPPVHHTFTKTDLNTIKKYPTLFLYEDYTSGSCRFGKIKKAFFLNNKVKIVPDFDKDFSITQLNVNNLSWELGIIQEEFKRTHWSIKEGDLYAILNNAGFNVENKRTESYRDYITDDPHGDIIKDKVFLVHGRDDNAKHKVTLFLKSSLNLQVVILDERPNKGRSVLTKFEQEASGAHYAVVLMTGDDLGHINSRLAGNPSPEQEVRSRQNVVFELGFFLGKLGTSKVCVLRSKDVTRPSDYEGIVYIDFDDGNQWKQKLAQELKVAGVEFNQNWWTNS